MPTRLDEIKRKLNTLAVEPVTHDDLRFILGILEEFRESRDAWVERAHYFEKKLMVQLQKTTDLKNDIASMRSERDR